jgi:hypothetical protein
MENDSRSERRKRLLEWYVYLTGALYYTSALWHVFGPAVVSIALSSTITVAALSPKVTEAAAPYVAIAMFIPQVVFTLLGIRFLRRFRYAIVFAAGLYVSEWVLVIQSLLVMVVRRLAFAEPPPFPDTTDVYLLFGVAITMFLTVSVGFVWLLRFVYHVSAGDQL